MFAGGENVNGATESMKIHVRWPPGINPSTFRVSIIRKRKSPQSPIPVAGKQNCG